MSCQLPNRHDQGHHHRGPLDHRCDHTRYLLRCHDCFTPSCDTQKGEHSACLRQSRIRTETFPKIRTTNHTIVSARVGMISLGSRAAPPGYGPWPTGTSSPDTRGLLHYLVVHRGGVRPMSPVLIFNNVPDHDHDCHCVPAPGISGRQCCSSSAAFSKPSSSSGLPCPVRRSRRTAAMNSSIAAVTLSPRVGSGLSSVIGVACHGKGFTMVAMRAPPLSWD